MGRRFAISDIHGCAATFRKLVLDILQFSRHDALYLLGDYVNKGPDSKGVFDFIFELANDGHGVHCLKGNHEAYLLEALEDPAKTPFFLERGGNATLDSFQVQNIAEIPANYLDFIQKLPLYLEAEGYYLVHAGFDFALAKPFEDELSMLNIRAMSIDMQKTGGRKVLHGHVPTPVEEMVRMSDFRHGHLSIDAGCVYHHIHTLKHLAAYDLDSGQLFFQKNIDRP